MSWTVKAEHQIRFIYEAGMDTILTNKDLGAHPEVERIRHMEISNEEKIRLLKEKEGTILRDVVNEKFSAVSEYAEKSQASKMWSDGFGEPDSSIDWQDVLGMGAAVEVEE